MNSAHLHLILNHLPVIGTLFLVLLIIAGLLQNSGQVQKTSLVFAVIVALTAIPAYLTGNPAESVVEHLDGISRPAILNHRQFAETALTITLLVGGLALLGLIAFRQREKPPLGFMVAVLVLAIISAGTMAWTADLGGKIRHPESLEEPAFPPSISTSED
jgi:hypothetical protein